MKDYRYVLSRKYPFVKKRELTELELIHERIRDYFDLISVVYMVCFFAMVIGFLSSLLKIVSG